MRSCYPRHRSPSFGPNNQFEEQKKVTGHAAVMGQLVLDHGYVNLIESWGSDERVIEAARMSTGKGFQGWSAGPCPDCNGIAMVGCSGCGGSGKVGGDEKLLAYLYTNKHATPFEMAGLVIEVKAPLFVFREWHRHRTQSYNEMSARYIPLPDENYTPTIERIVGGAPPTGNRQAQGVAEPADERAARVWLADLDGLYAHAQRVYEGGLGLGIPKELARLVVPVGRYSRMRASANLRNWLAFLTLRMAPNAQREIREYANAVGALIESRFPRTWNLFEQERSHAG